jgi:hypothetical protein
MNGLTQDLLPIRVEMPNGKPPAGEVLYQVNRTKDGYVVLLMNNRGVDKTQNGVARVDRRQFVDVVVRAKSPVNASREYTEPRNLIAIPGTNEKTFAVRVHPGDVQVIGLVSR